MPNTRAIWLMIAAMAAFAVCDAFVKLASRSLGVGQVTFLLAVGCAVPFIITLYRGGDRLITPAILSRAFVIRTAGEGLASISVVIALALMPLVVFSSIIQAQPLAVTLGAAVFLKEVVGWRRWIAIFVGFLGVIVVLRPGLDGFDLSALWALSGVLGMTMRDLGTRALARDIPTAQAAAWGLIAVMLGGLVLMPFTGGWTSIDPLAAFHVAGMIVSGTLAYLSITLAMRIGEVSAIASFRYTRIVFALLIGLVVFGERPDLWVWVGTAIIVASGLYALTRERARAA